jgi:hypothetical protein
MEGRGFADVFVRIPGQTEKCRFAFYQCECLEQVSVGVGNEDEVVHVYDNGALDVVLLQ